MCPHPLAVFHAGSIYAREFVPLLSHWVWGFTAGQCLELCFSGVGMMGWHSSVSGLQQHILPLKSVLAGMGGKWQLITIICDLVPSKKQISGNESSSLIGRASSSNCLSVCLSVSVCSLSFVNFYNDSLTQQQHFDDQRYSSCALAGVIAECARKI